MRPVLSITRRIPWLYLLLVAAACASAQQYPILAVPGAPHEIFTIFQDSHSALWLGTMDDVFRFDGGHFYSLRPYGFPRETPNSFAEDNEGGLWIATQGSDAGGGSGHGGIYRYQAGHVEKIASGDGLSLVALAPGVMVASLGTELNGKPAFGSLTLFRKSGGGWTTAQLLANQANHLTVDHQGRVLFPCPGGWCEAARQTLLDWQPSSGPLSVQRHAGNPLIERVLRDQFGCVWFRAEGFASYQCPADSEPKRVPESISQYDGSAHLEETANGSIFMLVKMALGRPGAFQVATGDNGLPEMNCAAIAQDGTIWIGSGDGLYRFMYPFQLESWNMAQGGLSPFSILRQGKDMLASGRGITMLDKDRRRWSTLPGSEGIQGNLAQGPNGTLMLASRYFLSQYDAGQGVLGTTAIPNASDLAISRILNADGEVLFGGDGIRQVSVVGKHIVLKPELPPQSSPVEDLRYDSQRKTVWACAGSDVLFRQNGVWNRITPQDGLPNLRCDALALLSNGDLWIGYQQRASTWIGNPTSSQRKMHFYNEGMNEVLAYRQTHFLREDHRDWLWRGNEVLYLASPESAKFGQWLRLDAQDGIAPTTVDGSPFYSDDDNSVWFSTETGITHFSPPADFATVFPQPAVFVGGLSLGQGSPTMVDALGKIPNGTDTQAHIGSMQFNRRNALHLRYRLLPGQSTWRDSTSFDLRLGKLRWGRHTLQVQAQLATGAWSPIVEREIQVAVPLWLSWPALLLFAASGGGLGIGAMQWRKRQQFQRDIVLPDLTAWRMSALSPETEHLVGTTLDGRYEIGHILSVGGFSSVARARDLQDEGKLCAVKIFRYELGDQDWVRHRFQHEVAALEQLAHPNIVRITGHGAIDTGAPYLVMEFIQGRSLRQVLDEGPVPPPRIAQMMRQISSALALLHQSSIFHRDLKPENLMVRQDADGQEQFVLIDFSIALVKSPDETFHGISRVAGTIGYMAPEQVTGYADPSTDIHSLAKVILEMLTGQRCSDLFPEATLDLPDHVRIYFAANPGVFQADSVHLLATALAFDPGHRPREVAIFAAPIIRDLETGI